MVLKSSRQFAGTGYARKILPEQECCRLSSQIVYDPYIGPLSNNAVLDPYFGLLSFSCNILILFKI